ncbi:MAG: hypothetical protein EHM55_25960 [Acidobacteria bacterium]|nr:MAG: hypothetical protein EHM55_25960 [Acidobacteriota bacterium]
MRFIAWDRLQWLPPLWGVVGAITFLLIPFRYEVSFFVSVGFVLVGGGLLFFIAKLPLTHVRKPSTVPDGQALRQACIE